jgi:ElaA protein
MKASFQCYSFDELSNAALYAMLQLRERVFIVEQNCPYLDLDGLDDQCLHVLGRWEDEVVATTRILPPGLKYPEVSVGRVVTSQSVRGTGIGRALMAATLDAVSTRFGPCAIRLSAQSYLVGFYGSFGFIGASEEYLEDNIPHIDMVRPAPE